MPMRVLTVARWYPSHDSPGRGSFVAELVDATAGHGAQHVVASIDHIGTAGQMADPNRQLRRAREAFRSRLQPSATLSRPRTWGPGAPVARLPVLLPHRDDADEAEDVDATIAAHEEPLMAFTERLRRVWRPSVIHAHTGLPDGIVSARIGRRWGVPVLVSEHASTIEAVLADPTALRRYRELLDPNVRLVAVSPSLRSRLARALGCPEDRIQVLPNVVAVDDFAGSARAHRRPGQLLWAGSRERHKGIADLLRAVALVRSSRPDIELRLIGRPRRADRDDEWRALAAELHLLDRVTFEDWGDQAAVADAMSSAAVFVHPSPSETFGVVAAEAIAAGLPVASRPSGGVPWLIETAGGFGRVAEDPSVEAFADAILALLNEAPAADPATARDRIRTAFGRDAVGAEAMRFYGSFDAPAPRGRRDRRGAPSDTSEPVPPDGSQDRPSIPALVVARNAVLAQRATEMIPQRFQDRIVVLTARDTRDNGRSRSEWRQVWAGRLVEVELDRNYRARRAELARPMQVPRILQRRLRPLTRWWRERQLRRLTERREPMKLEAIADAIRAQLTTRPADSKRPVTAVPVDLGAVLAILACERAGVNLAPGGVRWLMDRLDAGERTDPARPPETTPG